MREKRLNGEGQRRWTRAEADQLVEKFAASGLRRREFCLEHGIAVGTLDYWRKRRQERERQNRDSGRKVTDRLVAVELARWSKEAGNHAGSGGLTVVVSRRWRIEVARDFDTATLERLLNVLEQG
jgi:transposase-like protein